MTHLIDRRSNPKNKSLGNRQRFIRRAKDQLRDAVRKSIQQKNIADIASGDKVSIPTKGIQEPKLFQSSSKGYQERVLPGNREFDRGDRINKPTGGQGKGAGGKAGNSGEGEDDFAFTLSKDEFLDIFFEDLELPDLVKRKMKEVTSIKWHRAGYTVVGSPATMNILQTLQKAMGRRIALRRPREADLSEIKDQIFILEGKSDRTEEETEYLRELHAEYETRSHRMKSVPWIDPIDVRYNRFDPIPQPTTQAVMLCVMDVSGSMGEREKDLAKKFFMLLYLFLQRRYQRIDIIFIRHTHEAQEVDEEEFFYSRETGGTVVSASLDLMRKIISERYPAEDWNIYAAQASDGDNYPGDSEHCVDILSKYLMPVMQYYAYIEIVPANELLMSYHNGGGNLWENYKRLQSKNESFAMQRIGKVEDIFPVFRRLFSKSEVTV